MAHRRNSSQSGNGDPTSVTPEFIGQIYYDVLNNVSYIATSETTGDWFLLVTGNTDTLSIRSALISTTFTETDHTVVAKGENVTNTLPSAIGVEGKVYVLKNESESVASEFVLFSDSGAVSNTGISTITGDIGSNSGIISGFGTSIITGTTHFNNATTIAESLAVQTTHDSLMAMPATVTNHAPAFGSGESISPGVYTITGAGSVALNLTLDGGGNPNALFVFRFSGAFSVGAAANIFLTDGTKANNVYWVTTTGEIAIGADSQMRGNCISLSGAISMPGSSTLEGRLLSISGAISLVSSPSTVVPVGSAAPIGGSFITLDTSLSQTISGELYLNVQHRESITVQSDGTNWVQI